jgi:hypothetical protein
MLLYSLQRLFRDKKLQIPYSPEAKPKMRILLKELSYLEVKEGKYKSIKGHDDCAISLSLAAYAFSKFKCCLTYGVSNSSIYKDIFYYGAKKSYREQIEKNLELLSRYKK